MKVLNHKQGSEEWLQSKVAMVSGSRVLKVGDPAGEKTLITELIAEELTGQLTIGKKTDSMERGNIAEDFARDLIKKRLGLNFREVGMIISDDYDWLGYSADGYLDDG